MLKVGCSALVVGQTAIIEHLEENIEDLGMGFFNLIQ